MKAEPIYDLIAIGRSSLDLFGDAVGQAFSTQTKFSAYSGGCPANICVAAQRLGLKTAMLTGLGGDASGDFVLSFLEGEGIDMQFSQRIPGTHTNVVMAASMPPSVQFDVCYAVDGAADLQLTIAHVENTPISQSRALLITGISLRLDPCRTALQYAVRKAKAHDVKVFMDADLRPMWPDLRVYATLMQMTLPYVDVLIGGVDELCAAAGKDNLNDAITSLRSIVRQAIIVKKAEAGSTVVPVNGERVDISPFPTEAINVLGAGDAFAGGFIYGDLKGWPLTKAARFGNACGAILVGQHGTANAMPTLEQVATLIDGR